MARVQITTKEDIEAIKKEKWNYVENPLAEMSFIGNSEYVVAGIPNPITDQDWEEQPKQLARVRFMEAAPDMFVALEDAVKTIVMYRTLAMNMHGSKHVESVDKCLEKPLLALAKARGIKQLSQKEFSELIQQELVRPLTP